MRTAAPLILAALLAAGCSGTETAPDGTATETTAATESGIATNAADASPGATGASAALANAEGGARATATFTQAADGVRLSVTANDMPPGEKGIHIHTVGRCDPPKFESAGGHWNVNGNKHGREAPAGPHIGDLPNITVAADGTASYEATIAGATLAGGATPLLDADGSAIIIHAKADDYRTDPSGDSGDRLACGVVTAG